MGASGDTQVCLAAARLSLWARVKGPGREGTSRTRTGYQLPTAGWDPTAETRVTFQKDSLGRLQVSGDRQALDWAGQARRARVGEVGGSAWSAAFQEDAGDSLFAQKDRGPHHQWSGQWDQPDGEARSVLLVAHWGTDRVVLRDGAGGFTQLCPFPRGPGGVGGHLRAGTHANPSNPT